MIARVKCLQKGIIRELIENDSDQDAMVNGYRQFQKTVLVDYNNQTKNGPGQTNEINEKRRKPKGSQEKQVRAEDARCDSVETLSIQRFFQRSTKEQANFNPCNNIIRS